MLELGTATASPASTSSPPSDRLASSPSKPTRSAGTPRSPHSSGSLSPTVSTPGSGTSPTSCPGLLADTPPFGLVFEDGPHTPEVTWQAFELVIDHVEPGGLLVFDDIYHRHDGNNAEAWARIVTHRAVVASAEVNGRQGIVVKQW